MGDSYLVTGGAGFIGSHLIDVLLARGNRVVALDNLSTGRVENLAGVRGNASFRFVPITSARMSRRPTDNAYT